MTKIEIRNNEKNLMRVKPEKAPTLELCRDSTYHPTKNLLYVAEQLVVSYRSNENSRGSPQATLLLFQSTCHYLLSLVSRFQPNAHGQSASWPLHPWLQVKGKKELLPRALFSKL